MINPLLCCLIADRDNMIYL